MALILLKCGPMPDSFQCFKGNEVIEMLKTKSKTFHLKSRFINFHLRYPIPFLGYCRAGLRIDSLQLSCICLSNYAKVKRAIILEVIDFHVN